MTGTPAHRPPDDDAWLAQGLAAFARGRSSDPAVRALQQAFFERLRRPLEHVVRQVLGTWPDAQPVAMQEAWADIHASAASYDPARGGVLAWAWTITRRRALDVARSLKAEQEKRDPHFGTHNQWDDGQLEQDDGLDRLPCGLPGPDDGAYGSQVRAAVQACLQTLPADGKVPYRQAFELGVDTDLSLRELAAQLGALDPAWAGATDEQMRKWLSRATDKMRTCLRRRLDRQG